MVMQRSVLLVERTEPTIRKSLVALRRGAMRGALKEVLRDLDLAIGRQEGLKRPRETVALGLLKAELLHLDCEEELAQKVWGITEGC